MQVKGVQPLSALPNAQQVLLAKLYNFHKSSDLSKGEVWHSAPQSGSRIERVMLSSFKFT